MLLLQMVFEVQKSVEATGPIAIAWILLMGAIFVWGTMYVPARDYESYDGSIFQWYMGCSILFTGIIIHFMIGTTTVPGTEYQTMFPIYWEGIVGGILWSISNILVVPSVKLLGLGVGFTVYHAINLILGYLNGKYGLYGLSVEKTNIGMDLSIVWFIASFVLIMLVEPTITRPRDAQGEINQSSQNTLQESIPSVRNEDNDESKEKECIETGEIQKEKDNDEGVAINPLAETIALMDENITNQIEESTKRIRFIGGMIIAIFGGYFTSVNMVPYSLWVEKTKKYNPSPFHFTLSQCLGVFFMSTIYVLLASLFHRLWPPIRQWPKHPVLLPALSAGSMWAIGFALSSLGVATLGMTIGYVLTAVGPVGVSALWTQFYFQEIRGQKNQMKFWTAIVLQATGVLSMAALHP